jgi:hypothetical protein
MLRIMYFWTSAPFWLQPLFADGGCGKLPTAWRDLLGHRTRVLILATNVKVSNRWAPFDLALRTTFYKQIWNQNAVFWDVAPCGFIIYRRFGGTCSLYLQGRKINESESFRRLLTGWLQSEEHCMRTLREEGGNEWSLKTLKSYIDMNSVAIWEDAMRLSTVRKGTGGNCVMLSELTSP